MSKEWLVARCKPSDTIAISKELYYELGIVVEAPTVWHRLRIPRLRRVKWVECALLPSFLFIHSNDSSSAEMEFSRMGLGWFWVNGAIGSVDTSELKAIGTVAEEEREKKESGHGFKIGDIVIVSTELFNNTTGVIRGWDGMHHDVEINGFSARLKISPFLLKLFKR